MKTHALTSTETLVAWNVWLRSILVAAVTGWRWRRRGWIQPLNIAGKLYLTRDQIMEFQRRAAGGEFAHKLPLPSGNKAQ